MRSPGKPTLPTTVPRDDDSMTSAGERLVERGAIVKKTQTSYMTAIQVQRERVLTKAQAGVIEEAKLVGEDFYYTWTVRDKSKDKEMGPGKGRSTVEGTSIDGAMILARNWGNCACEVEVEQDAPTFWMFRATFIDFETGFNEARLFRQRKSESHMKGDADRALDIAFQIGQSKAKRNVIVKSIPAWLVNAGTEAAKNQTIEKYKKKFETVAKGIEATKAKFATLNVTPEQLMKKIGLPFDQWQWRDLITLAGILRAIEVERVTTVDQEFNDAALDGDGVDTAPTATTTTPAEGATTTTPAPANDAPTSSKPQSDAGDDGTKGGA